MDSRRGPSRSSWWNIVPSNQHVRIRPDGDNMLTPPPTCVDEGEMKEAVVFQRRDGSTRLLQRGLAKTRSRSPLKERRRSGAVDGHRSFLRAWFAQCFALPRYIRHLLMQLVYRSTPGVSWLELQILVLCSQTSPSAVAARLPKPPLPRLARYGQDQLAMSTGARGSVGECRQG